MAEYCQLQLTCANKVEADSIAKALLEKRLIACAKQITISSDFRWRGKIEHSKEVLLLMDSKMKNFKRIETEIKKLQSYDTFVLQAILMSKISEKAKIWLDRELDV